MAGFQGSFANVPRRAGAARKAVVDCAGEYFSAQAVAAIEAAVGEVLASSARLGYRTAPLVNINASLDDSAAFTVEISDGIAPPHGRGMRIIHELMDRVEYLESERCVRLTKFLTYGTIRI